MSEFLKEIGKIAEARIGREDHGIFVLSLDFNFGSCHQGAVIVLDNPSGEKDKGRVGTAIGMQIIIDVMRAANVNWFDNLVGRNVYVLRTAERGIILGMEGLPFEGGRRVIFFKEDSCDVVPDEDPEKEVE